MIASKVRNAGAIFLWGLGPGVARGLLRWLEPRASDRWVRLLFVGTVGSQLPSLDPSHRLQRIALRQVANDVLVLSAAEDLPAHGEAVAVRMATEVSRDGAQPRTIFRSVGLVGVTATVHRNRDVPVRLNTSENPHPPSPAVAAAIADYIADEVGGLQRYP